MSVATGITIDETNDSCQGFKVGKYSSVKHGPTRLETTSMIPVYIPLTYHYLPVQYSDSHAI